MEPEVTVPLIFEQLFGTFALSPLSVKIAIFGLPLAALLLAEDGHEVVFAVLSPVEAPGGRA